MKDILAAIGVFVLAVAIGLLLTYPEMWLFNYVFSPALLSFCFGVAKLTFWRTFWTTLALGLIFRGGILSGGGKKK